MLAAASQFSVSWGKAGVQAQLCTELGQQQCMS